MFLGFIIRKLRFLGHSRRSTGDGTTVKNDREQAYKNEIKDQLHENVDCIKGILGGSNDLKVHQFRFGPDGHFTGALVYIDGLADKTTLTEAILRPATRWQPHEKMPTGQELTDVLVQQVLCTGDVKTTSSLSDITSGCLSGDTVILLDGCAAGIIVSTKGWEKRSVTEPQSETVVRGPREGFTENLRTNTALIRRKIKSEKLRVEHMIVGRKTHTDVCLMYLDGVADHKVVDTVKYRISRLDVDSILESGYIEEYVEDAPFSPFATVGYSEKPDVVAGRLLEGRVAVVVDGTPFVLTAPMLFIESFQTAEDYYTRPLYASLMRILRYLAKERAKGGVGLIIVEVSEINYENGSSALNSVRVDTSRCVPQMRRLAEAVHVYDTKIFTQLHHGGNQAARIFNDGHEPVSASDVKCEALADRPRALSNSEVKEYIQKYIFSASMAKLAHYDGVEIHAAHGYLPCQFFDPHTNRRTDEYGGSFENRMRFATEIIQGIKAACGSDFPVSVRISVDMFTSHGYGLEEGVKIAKAMEAAGADAINCSFGNYESFPASVETASFEQGWRVYMAEAVKNAVNVPVIAVGTLREPAYIEKILEENKTDFVAIGRGLIADPEWCNKAQQGREKEIRKCISCLTCLYNVLGCGIVCCAINARAGHEAEYPKPLKDGNGRKVVVVGGGPAGIEAARICALRGFNVVLFEKGPALGGQLQLAKKALHQERINWFIEYATNEMDRLGVDVRLDCAVTANTIRKENPYAVYIATGGMPSIPNVAGVNKSNVITAEDYLSGKITLTNEKAVIIGGGITGGETAVLIAANGGKATVVEMLCSICTDMYPDSRTDIIHDMEKYGVNVLTNSMLMEIKDNAVILKDVTTDETKEISADKVIIATGVKPVNALYDELADEMEYIYTLGDAMHQGKIIDAVKTAHVRALDLE